jgi:hypothetical protein
MSNSISDSGTGYSVVAYAVGFPPFTGIYAAPDPSPFIQPIQPPVWPVCPALEAKIEELEKKLAESEGKNKAYQDVIRALLAELKR